jgi:hypothetical protein
VSYNIKNSDGKFVEHVGDAVTRSVIGNKHGSKSDVAVARKASLGNGEARQKWLHLEAIKNRSEDLLLVQQVFEQQETNQSSNSNKLDHINDSVLESCGLAVYANPDPLKRKRVEVVKCTLQGRISKNAKHSIDVESIDFTNYLQCS